MLAVMEFTEQAVRAVRLLKPDPVSVHSTALLLVILLHSYPRLGRRKYSIMCIPYSLLAGSRCCCGWSPKASPAATTRRSRCAICPADWRRSAAGEVQLGGQRVQLICSVSAEHQLKWLALLQYITVGGRSKLRGEYAAVYGLRREGSATTKRGRCRERYSFDWAALSEQVRQ